MADYVYYIRLIQGMLSPSHLLSHIWLLLFSEHYTSHKETQAGHSLCVAQAVLRISEGSGEVKDQKGLEGQENIQKSDKKLLAVSSLSDQANGPAASLVSTVDHLQSEEI